MGVVLFNSARPLGRCENVTAVFDAYKGPKRFVRGGYIDVTRFGGTCPVVVTDEFVRGKADGQRVVMIAHGLTGGKLYGADQPKGQFQYQNVSAVDWYVTSSRASVPFAASAARIPEGRCLPLGMPRTDAYFGVRKGDGCTALGKFPRAYLYAPTFRARYDAPCPVPDWAALDEMMDDDEILVVKRHMNVPSPILGGRRHVHIVEAGNDEPSTPYLVDCDVLVTDYSSILFDGHVLGKPSVLVCDDMDGYLSTRGMYRSYPHEYSSRALAVVGHEREWLDEMRDACRTGMREDDMACRDFVADACDGHSAERVARFVASLL